MRIILVVHQFLPKYFAGTENLTLSMAKSLRDKGHEVAIITGEPIPWSEYGSSDKKHYVDEFEGFKVLRLIVQGLMYCKSNMGICDPLYKDEIRSFVEDFKPDIIHINHSLNLSLRIIELFDSMSIPIIYSSTDYWLVCPTGQLLRWNGDLCAGPSIHCGLCMTGLKLNKDNKIIVLLSFIDQNSKLLFSYLIKLLKIIALISKSILNGKTGLIRAKLSILYYAKRFFLKNIEEDNTPEERLNIAANILKKAKRLIVTTEFMKDLFVQNGFSEENIEIIPYGIDHPDIECKPKLPCGNIRIGFIGNTYPTKGLKTLISAFKLLQDKNISLELYFKTTNDSYSKEILELVKTDKRIKLHGSFPPEKIWEVLDSMDILVVPSTWYENLPLVLLSGLVVKKAVVVSDVGGLTELVQHGKSGMIFQRADYQDLANKLNIMIQNPTLIQEFGNNVPQISTSEEYINKILGIYRNALIM